MSLTYRISSSGDQVRVVGKGHVDTTQCIRLVERVMADPRCHSAATALVDLHNATYEPDDLAEIIDIGKELVKFQARLKNHIAIVARQSTLFPAAILSHYLRKTVRTGIKVFVDLAAAEAYCRRNWHPSYGVR